jgi:hypothetical protein
LLRLNRFLQQFDNWRVLPGLAAAIIVLAVSLANAGDKPLWFDELLSFHLAQLDDWEQLDLALLEAADTQPPISYLLIKLSHSAVNLFGIADPELRLATRLPSFFALSLTTFLLFRLVRPYVGSLAAIGGVLFYWLDWGYSFGLEARPYTLMLLWLTAALCFWRRAIDQPSSWIGPLGLFACLTAAAGTHYYSVVMFLPIAGGELARTIERRKIDAKVWSALILAPAPLLFMLPAINAVRTTYSQGFWSPAMVEDYLGAYIYLALPIWKIALALIPFLILAHYFSRKGNPAPDTAPRVDLSPSFRIALVLLALLPLASVTLALLVTKAYVYRYALPGTIGLSFWVAYGLRGALSSRVARAGAVAILAAGFITSSASRDLFRDTSDVRENRIALANSTRDRTKGLRMVATSPIIYLEDQHLEGLDFEGPLEYVADPESALQYCKTDSPELNIVRLGPWAGLQVTDYDSFISQNQDFVLWHRPGDRFEWIVKRLKDEGHVLTPLAESDTRAVLRCCS